MKLFRIYGYAVLLFLPQLAFAQLRPGFDKAEYINLLKMSAYQGDSSYFLKFPQPQHAALVYTSAVMGLENRWQLWLRDDGVAVINIRGTVASQLSWLANFYSAMFPAKGTMTLADGRKFSYNLARNPKAAVHCGWTIATGYLAGDILPKIDSLYVQGTRDWIVTGHSQGGAIAYLFTAYLYSLQQQGQLPADIRIKTYCSAAPKPGNLYFAHEYEARTQMGWAYNVVNSADWVPETPFSVQTIDDFNKTNVFIQAPQLIKKQKFPLNWVARHAFNRLDKPTRKAQRNFEKYLGRVVGKQVVKNTGAMHLPEFYPSADFVRVGQHIVLLADDDYYKLYKDNTKNVFVHHMLEPYLYLTERLPDND